jgi:hypothetical protein
MRKVSGSKVDSQPDKRRYQRQWQNQVLLTTPVSGRIVDMNVAGMGIETREPLTLRAHEVFTCASGRARLEFKGEVRWCRFTDSIPLLGGDRSAVYRAGIAFVDDQHSD